jgi:CHAT domain-containing protein
MTANLTLTALAIGALLGAAYAGPSPQQTVETNPARRPLVPGSAVGGELGRARVQSHRIEAHAGEYVRVTIEPHGVSPIVTVLDPTGTVIAQAQDPEQSDAPLHLSFIAERSGLHELRLTARGPEGQPGRYLVTVDPPRAPTAEDRARMRAERAFDEAVGLASKGAAESRREAIRRYEEARQIRRQLGETAEEAAALSEVGGLQFVLGAPRDARATFEETLALTRRAHDQRGEAQALNNLGVVAWSLGELPAALERYGQALALFRELGLVRDEAIALNNIANVHKDLGDPRKALEMFERSLPLRRQAGDLRGQAICLNNVAIAHLMVGEEWDALAALEQALPLARAAGDQGAEISVLQTLGALWLGNGELERALETFGVVLELNRRGGNRAGEAYVLARMGDVQRLKGDYAQALSLQQRALELRRALGDRVWEARILTALGRAYRLQGELAAAEETLSAALRLHRELGNRYNETYTLLELGSVWQALGALPRADEAFAQALPLSRSIDDAFGEATALFRIAQLRRAQGALDEARNSSEAAVAVHESIRARVAGPQSRASFFAPAQEIYDFLIDLIMAMDAARPERGLAEQAFDVSERKRARSLLDLLAESRADTVGGADTELRRQLGSLRDRLSARTQDQVRLLGSRQTEQRAAANAHAIQELLAEYERLERKVLAEDPAHRRLMEGGTGGSRELRKLLDERTVLLEFSLGEAASYAWAVTRDAVHAVRLPPAREITTAARAFYDALASSPAGRGPVGRAPGSGLPWEAAGAELSRALLAPLAAHLDRQRVVVVADGILHYVPFGALPEPTGQRLLLESHEVVLLPSGSALAALRAGATTAPGERKAVAVIADPVFDAGDPRVVPARPAKDLPAEAPAPVVARGDVLRAADDVGLGGTTASFGRLAFSRREAEAIVAVAPPGSVLRALDFDASRQTALSPDLARYRIVHFATHGFVDDRHPELSGLVLSLVDREGRAQNGFLRLRDIYGLRLPAELVVLSGCRTGLGQEIRGEGLLGLVRGFMYAGTPRVIATLWSVEDRATAVLMSEFYRKLLGSRLPPAEALRRAQLAVRAQPRWRHPFYWAGFALEGDWQ